MKKYKNKSETMSVITFKDKSYFLGRNQTVERKDNPTYIGKGIVEVSKKVTKQTAVVEDSKNESEGVN